VSTAGFRIRRATPDDAAELARIRYAFRAELDPPLESENVFRERCARWMMAQLGPAGRWWCWVAVLGTTVVGTLWLQLIEKLPNPVGHRGLHGYVSSVYVLPELRNAGIGSALLAACLAEVDALQLDAVFLWPTARSRGLYERHGFMVRDDLLERRLQTPDS
jgi:ribosomal protein S18 acetylase RimI-like enzyme